MILQTYNELLEHLGEDVEIVTTRDKPVLKGKLISRDVTSINGVSYKEVVLFEDYYHAPFMFLASPFSFFNEELHSPNAHSYVRLVERDAEVLTPIKNKSKNLILLT